MLFSLLLRMMFIRNSCGALVSFPLTRMYEDRLSLSYGMSVSGLK